MRATFAAIVIVSVLGLIPFAPLPAAAKTVGECNTEYATNKAAIKATGQKKKDFITACKAGTETIPAPVATPAAAPAAMPTPAPTVAAKPKPEPTRTTVATPTGAGGFPTDAQAKVHCPSDTVVWVNTNSGVYHFAGTHNYGATKAGDYMCEADAKAAGDRAAKNEKHP